MLKGKTMEESLLPENWGLNEDSEIIQQLKSLTPTEVFLSDHLYKCCVVYASRASDSAFLKHLAIAGLYTESLEICEGGQIFTDIIDLLQRKEFAAIQKHLFENSDSTEVLQDQSKCNLITSLLFSGCPPECLESIIDLFIKSNESKRKDVLDKYDWHEFTPLVSAVFAGNLECIQSLLLNGAKVDQSVFCGVSSFLNEIGIDFEVQDSLLCIDHKDPLICAVCIKNPKCVEILLDFKPNLSNLFGKRKSALCYAVELCDTECLHMLLKELNQSSVFVNDLAEVALPYSVTGGDIQCVTLLLEYCDNLNKMDLSGRTALMVAAEAGKTSYVKMFLERGANVNTSDVFGCKETALMLACKHGHYECVDLLLQYNASIEAVSNPRQETALMYACRGGSTECVTLLLEFKASMQTKNRDLQTPLLIAVMSNADDCVKILLEQNANVDQKDKGKMSALMHAVLLGNTGCVELLVNELKKRKEGCLKPAFGFCKSSQIKVHHSDYNAKASETKALISNNKVSETKSYAQSAGAKKMGKNLNYILVEESLPYAVKGGNLKCVELLLPLCSNFNCVEDADGKTALMLAAEKGMEDIVKRLLEYFADVNITSYNGQQTALLLACENRHVGCMNLLLQHNSGSNVVSKLSKETALMRACRNGNAECVSLLLKYNTDVDIEDDRLRTPLILAILNSQDQTVKVLLEHGAKIELKDHDGMTALMYAAEVGNAECVELLVNALLKKGEHPVTGSSLSENSGSYETENSKTSNISHERSAGILDSLSNVSRVADESLPHAVKSGSMKCVKLILPLCVNLNSVGNTCHGETAILLAMKTDMAASDHIECLKLLLDHGAYPDAVNRYGESASFIAVAYKKLECLELLIRHGADVNIVCSSGLSALTFAALQIEGNVKWLKVLSDAGAYLGIERIHFVQKLLDYPKNIEFLLKEDKFVVKSEENLFENGVLFLGTNERHFKSASLLMEYGVFDWSWWRDIFSFSSISFLAVQASLFPGLFWYNGVPVSPLQFALLSDNVDLVKYLMSNLYYSINDYSVIISNSFKQRQVDEIKSPFLVSLVEQLRFNPWNLQTLCLLTISTTLSYNGSPKGRLRRQQVDSLPIPEMLKSILKFKGSHGLLCPGQWKSIGNANEPKELLCPTKISNPPIDLLTPCVSSCDQCVGYGLTLKE